MEQMDYQHVFHIQEMYGENEVFFKELKRRKTLKNIIV